MAGLRLLKGAIYGTPLASLGLGLACYAADEGMIPPLSNVHPSFAFAEHTYRTMKLGASKVKLGDIGSYEGGRVKYQEPNTKKDFAITARRSAEDSVRVSVKVPPGKLGVRLKEKIGGGVVLSALDDQGSSLADVPSGSALLSVDSIDVSSLPMQEVQAILGDRYLMNRELELLCSSAELSPGHRCLLGQDVTTSDTSPQEQLRRLREYERHVQASSIAAVGGKPVGRLLGTIGERKREAKRAMRQ